MQSTDETQGAPLTVAQARERKVCRVCGYGQRNRIDQYGSISTAMAGEPNVFSGGEEYAHWLCLVHEARINKLKENHRRLINEFAELSSEKYAVEKELERLKRGDWTPDEIQNICERLNLKRKEDN